MLRADDTYHLTVTRLFGTLIAGARSQTLVANEGDKPFR